MRTKMCLLYNKYNNEKKSVLILIKKNQHQKYLHNIQITN